MNEMVSEARSIDPDEVARFDAMGAQWWDPNGPLAPLHALNPVRLRYVRDRLVGHFDRDPVALAPLGGLRLLDVGCGGGLISEPMARLGASVTGIDAAAGNIAVARRHAEANGLEIDYRATSVEEIAGRGARYDVVLALEIVEHVADLGSFLAAACACVAPGGMMILSTLNRTPRAFALAIVGAEYVMRWLPRGTHQWSRFVRPAEMVRALRKGGLTPSDLTGLSYHPLRGDWKTGGDLSVNYFASATASRS